MFGRHVGIRRRGVTKESNGAPSYRALNEGDNEEDASSTPSSDSQLHDVYVSTQAAESKSAPAHGLRAPVRKSDRTRGTASMRDVECLLGLLRQLDASLLVGAYAELRALGYRQAILVESPRQGAPRSEADVSLSLETEGLALKQRYGAPQALRTMTPEQLGRLLPVLMGRRSAVAVAAAANNALVDMVVRVCDMRSMGADRRQHPDALAGHVRDVVLLARGDAVDLYNALTALNNSAEMRCVRQSLPASDHGKRLVVRRAENSCGFWGDACKSYELRIDARGYVVCGGFFQALPLAQTAARPDLLLALLNDRDLAHFVEDCRVDLARAAGAIRLENS